MTVTIDANDPRVDREFGAEFCHLWGIDPNQVVQMTYYFDPATSEGVVEFWGHHWEDGYWAHEVDAPQVQPQLSAGPRQTLIHRVRYAIELESM